VNYYGPGYEPSLLLGAASYAVANNRVALVGMPTRMVVRDTYTVDRVTRVLRRGPIPNAAMP
jgi:hypothetical protein